MLRTFAAAVLAVAACGPAVPPPAQTAQPPAGSAQQPQEAVAPQPFTPQEIAAAMPPGSVIRYRFEPQGQGVHEEEWTVTAADARTITMATKTTKPDGSVENIPAETSTWEELANHGAFPQSITQISDGEITVPAGTFKTKVYVVTKDDAVTRFHFAPSLPGPPVLLEMDKGGQRILTMTLLSRTPMP